MLEDIYFSCKKNNILCSFPLKIIYYHKIKGGKKPCRFSHPVPAGEDDARLKCSFKWPKYAPQRRLSHLARWDHFHPLTTVIVWTPTCQETLHTDGERETKKQSEGEGGGEEREVGSDGVTCFPGLFQNGQMCSF